MYSMNFVEAIAELNKELNFKYSGTGAAKTGKKESKRCEIIRKIESIAREIVKNIANSETPVLQKTFNPDWSNCDFDDRTKIRNLKKPRKVDFSRNCSRSKFTSIVFLLSKIHKLLMNQQTTTRRALYYKNLKIFRTQDQVDDAMKDVCCILKEPPWNLSVLATSKGIVCGPLVLELADGKFLDCSKKGGVPVPLNVAEVKGMSSSAALVLIVEKDASFQQIIGNEAAANFGPCIFVTGKGFPDVSTRFLVCKFWEHLRIPILSLVDADPYGFEIMCVYRFGSAAMSSYSEHLACPAVRWLGVHPGDIQTLLLDSQPLSSTDVQKVHHLLKRGYVDKNETFKAQLKILLKGNAKAEIEGVANISNNYLIDVYMKRKLESKDYY